jgi:dTDP-4-amino-4,6-dideoxygalactose transaminase
MTARPEDPFFDPVSRDDDAAPAAPGDSATDGPGLSEADRQARFDVMLDLVARDPRQPVVLCDLACGTGELLAHLRRRGLDHVSYRGIDRSELALAHAGRKFPGAEFICLDVTAPGADLRALECDYLVACGLFTRKGTLTNDAMRAFMELVLDRAWPRARRGLAFNVMSTAVDWPRDDLFHVPMDDLARLLHRLAGRRVTMRADYGLYEYTAYALKDAARGEPGRAPAPPPAGPRPLPVLRPRLPTADRLQPYLRRIDRTRIYSNFGPLARELARRLGARFSLPDNGVALASSGHAALLGAILAAAGRARPERPIALIPAYTFIATATAAELAGYQPVFVDVDEATWTANPRALLAHPELTRAGVVIPVAAYGRPVTLGPWADFQERTGVPVVVDAAAAFDTLVRAPAHYLGTVPVALSFHATKVFSTGEGGGVMSVDLSLIERVTQALNFGFAGSRDAVVAATNGRLSEFHAAVGLAELDGWDDKIAEMERVVHAYRRAFARANLNDRLVTSPVVGLGYVLGSCAGPAEAAAVERALAREAIDFRYWYSGGLHRHTYYRRQPRSPLDTTEQLAARLIGLPFAPDLQDEAVARVTAAFAEGVGARV